MRARACLHGASLWRGAVVRRRALPASCHAPSPLSPPPADAAAAAATCPPLRCPPAPLARQLTLREGDALRYPLLSGVRTWDLRARAALLLLFNDRVARAMSLIDVVGAAPNSLGACVRARGSVRSGCAAPRRRE